MTEMAHGFFVIDKPEGLTSHDVVQAVRSHLKIRRVGHLGTLDPMATGVLPLALGKATRLIQFLTVGLKIYQGTIRLGFSTDTYDKEGQATSAPVVPDFSPQQLLEVGQQMLGEQFQVPPPYSAKKVGGIRSYHLARQGIEVTLAARRVHIAQLKFVQRQANEVDFEIHCSAGTYIRSIAHELGKKLACGAHLTRLRRITAGEFYLDRAITLDSFITSSWTELSKHFISVNAVLRALPELEVDAAIQISLNHGNDFGIRTRYLQIKPETLFRMVSPSGELLGLAVPLSPLPAQELNDNPQTYFHPKLVLQGSCATYEPFRTTHPVP